MLLNESLFSIFLNQREILWVGIDFSQAKFTKKGFDVTQDTLRNYFHEWNLLIISDQKKYDIRLSFRKPVMSYDLSWVTKTNKSIKINNILRENIALSNVRTEEEIQTYVQNLELPKTHRFALMFIVESFDSISKTGSVWVVIQDTETKATVLAEKFLKFPSGFGTKSYWSRVFYNIFYDIKSYAFYRWENLVKE